MKIGRVKEEVKGSLRIKRYPTGCMNMLLLKSYLDELLHQDNFVPDVIFIDYLRLCSSFKYKSAKDAGNMAYLLMYIAEEMRNFGIEHNVPIITATQMQRGSSKKTDMENDDIGDSKYIADTADFTLGIVVPDETARLCKQAQVNIMKSRLGKSWVSFMVGLDYPRMRFYDLDAQQQNLIQVKEEKPEAPRSKFDSPVQKKRNNLF
jgi:replicative DNA helicase